MHVLDNSFYHLPNYTIIEQPRTIGKRGGGVLKYVLNRFPSVVRTKFSVSDNHVETLFIELSFSNSRNVVLGTVYRPSNGKYHIFKNSQLSKE